MASDSRLKVLHVSTFTTGGAANSAIRLFRSQLAAGYDVKFLSLYKGVGFEEGVSFLDSLNFTSRLLASFNYRISKRRLPRLPANFTLPYSPYDITASIHYEWADVVHFQWVANFLDYSSFFRKCKKPVVWTFHDEHPLRGGAHYQYYLQGQSDQVLKIEKDMLYLKQKILRNFKPIQVACPSKWLYNLTLESPIFEGKTVHYVPYGIDTLIFHPRNKLLVKKELGLPSNKTNLLVVATDLSDPRKGMQYLPELMKRLPASDFHFCIIGHLKNEQSLPINASYLGQIHNEELLAKIYAATDLLLMLSLADNLPNVLLEAMACGTPAVGFNVGGVSDVIVPGETGILVDAGNLKDFLASLFFLAKNPALVSSFTSNAREFAISKFSLEHQLQAYERIYNMLA